MYPPLLGTEDALRRPVQLLRVDRAALGGGERRGSALALEIGIARNEYHIHARAHRLHDAVRRAVMPPDSVHYHAVAENKPVKAQRFAQKAVHDRARHRGRNAIWLNVREEDVAAHYGGNARLDRRAERNELARFKLVHRFLDAGKPDVGIHGGVAVAGEMLAAAEHAAVFIALHGLCAEERDALRIVAEAAHADHGVHGVGVHVEIGREIEIHADTAQLPRRDLRGENGIFRLSGRGKRHAAGDVHRVPRRRVTMPPSWSMVIKASRPVAPRTSS